MPEEFLNNLDVRAARAQERRTDVAEGMPPDLLDNANSSRNHADSILHE
jgi:hypothetical protein